MDTDLDRDQESTSDRLQVLRDLVAHPGWILFRDQALREWGPEGYGRRMREALTSVATGPDRAFELATKAEQVEMTARAVDEIFAWPQIQIGRLAPKAKPQGPFAGLRRITR